jgi:hypothetical protein
MVWGGCAAAAGLGWGSDMVDLAKKQIQSIKSQLEVLKSIDLSSNNEKVQVLNGVLPLLVVYEIGSQNDLLNVVERLEKYLI